MHEVVEFAASVNSMDALTVQVHDSRGMGVANVGELARMGLRNIDTSLAGSGGHPAAPGAPVGGVCTEDAVQTLELMGHPTGVDLPAVIEAANWLDQIFGGHEKGFVGHAGPVPFIVPEGDLGRPTFTWSA